jgi:hypothetical protein
VRKEFDVGWKIYWVVSAIFFALGVWSVPSQHPTLLGWLSLPVDALALLGLFAYAFERQILTPRFWQVLLWAYAAVSGAANWEMVRLSAERGLSPVYIGGAFFLSAFLILPTMVALFRYSKVGTSRPRVDPLS